jgi:hypothetical protein
MNYLEEFKQLLKLVRGIEHYLERTIKTIENTEKIREQGVVIVEDNEANWISDDEREVTPTTEFEF